MDEKPELTPREARQGRPPREARQGRLGRPVLIILLASLALAVLAWLVL